MPTVDMHVDIQTPDYASPRDPVWRAYQTPWPLWVKDFRQHQLDAVEQIIDGYRRGKKVMVLDAPVGCLSGDTLIPINRGGKGYKVRLDSLVNSFNGGKNKGKRWDLKIPTRAQSADGEVIRLGTIANAYYSGDKPTWTLTSGMGHEIRATLDHRFLTPDGWRRLEELKYNDLVAVNVGKGGKEHKPKPAYRYVGFLEHHPFARWNGPKNGHRVLKHRLVVEARMNEMSYESFIASLKAGDIDGLDFLDPLDYDVHHLDHDALNNHPDNLEILTPIEHQQRHASEGSWRHVMDRVGWDEVHSIVKWGIEPTFDITMDDAPHNFIANKFVVHNSGKTLIAEMVRRRLGTDMLYVAHSRGLQDQFLADFAEYARVLKGRSNYETELYTYPMYTASDCTAAGGACKFCTGVDACAYQVAKKEARGARVAVVNTAYMLSEAGGKGALCTKRAFTVVDECDTLEPILAGTVEFSVGSRDVEWLGIDPPKKGAHGRTVASWVRDEWMEREVARYKDLARETGGSELDQVKRRRRLKQMADRMAAGRRAADGIEGDGWVRDYQPGKGLVLKPVMVDWAGQERVWRHADKWLLMSGTVIDAQVMCDGLGLDRDEWELVTVPMTFPAENRITRVVPVVKMTKKELDADEKGVMDALESALWVILERHASGGRDPEDRQNVLLHTVSYRLSEMVEEVVREWCEAQVDMYGDEGRVPLHTYRAASDRDHALEQFKLEGGVLIGPSLDRGVDLPGDLCRVQVIVKVPFPNLGDKVIATRMRNAGGLNARGEQMTGGQRWYATETARVIVQMTGRGVRSATDWCVTYVLDKAFLEWYNRDGKALLPKWWRDAMKMELVRDYQ